MVLIAVSLLPVVLLMLYFYYRDKFEKEPAKTLWKALAGGIISTFVAIIFSTLIMLFIPVTEGVSAIYKSFVMSFFGAAIPEENAKFALLFLFMWNDRNFNERYDGILYSVFVALGFAGVENIMYVAQHGMGIAISRGLLAVPLHALCGVIMGYYFALGKFYPAKRFGYLFKAVFWPIMAHGVYDFILFYMESFVQIHEAFAFFAMILVFGFVIFLWKTSLEKVKLHVENSVFKDRKDEELV